MLLVTFFSILERPGENRKGGCNNPPWLDEGYCLITAKSSEYDIV